MISHAGKPAIRKFCALASAAILAAGSVAVVGTPAAEGAGSADKGAYRVKTGTESPRTQTGMVPGAVALSYKANGPTVGYLFADDFVFADGQTHGPVSRMDVDGVGHGSAGYHRRKGAPTDLILRQWPWGFAGGGYGGCAYVYGAVKLSKTGSKPATKRCAHGPRKSGSSKSDHTPDKLQWWHAETEFCRTGDWLCSRAGVWSTNKGWPAKFHWPAWSIHPSKGGYLTTRSTGVCPAYGNIGAASVFGATASRGQDPLGTLSPDTKIGVRYVTKSGWVMVRRLDGQTFWAGIVWAFVPRSCLSDKPRPAEPIAEPKPATATATAANLAAPPSAASNSWNCREVRAESVRFFASSTASPKASNTTLGRGRRFRSFGVENGRYHAQTSDLAFGWVTTDSSYVKRLPDSACAW